MLEEMQSIFLFIKVSLINLCYFHSNDALNEQKCVKGFERIHLLLVELYELTSTLLSNELSKA